MNRLVFTAAAAAALSTSAFGQIGAAGAGNNAVVEIDPVAATFVSYAWGGASGSSRGHMYGWDANIWRSAWTLNGIVRNDLPSTTSVTNIVNDPTNLVMGAPYQPTWDRDATDGPGILCIDGNPAPAPAPSAMRNWFVVERVDTTAPTFGMTAWFANTAVPMSDCYNHPLVPNEIVTVGFATSDQNIDTWVVPNDPTAPVLVTPTTVLTLTNECRYDALIHEDGRLYCWHSSAANGSGFTIVDLAAATQTWLPVPGIPFAGSGYAAVWNDPYELPGRMAYVLDDATELTYWVNLFDGSSGAVAVAPPVGAYNTAREHEEAQLTTHVLSNGDRRFKINFGPAAAGDTYALLPCVTGYAPAPLVINGQEIWLNLDALVFIAFANIIGNTFGALDANGQVDVDVNWPLPGPPPPLTFHWVALRANGPILDVSNYECTTLP